MSRPFLCECGSLLNVGEIAPGSQFSCPSCGAVRRLDLSDPGLLSSFSDDDGVYSLMLKKRLTEVQALDMAVPIEDPSSRNSSPRPSDTRTSPGPALLASPGALGLADGDQLGPFRIEQVLGQGGMGTVYEAFDLSLQRTVALKVLSDDHARTREVIDRFQREARAAGSLTHPNITHIYSIGEDRGFHYFAMELIRGRTLSQVQEQEGRISEQDAAEYLIQVCRGLRAAKRKEIIHRDLKPSNLILSEHGLVKITDFGLAKVVTSPIDITATGVIVGTPLYMSPEQGKGEPLDHRSDIYSLGCTFYHLLSGSPPFEGETAMSIIVRHITEEPPILEARCPNLNPRLASVVQRMMLKNPLDRFQNYVEIIEALSVISASSSSSRIESTHGRVVLTAERVEDITADSMGAKQLSVADVNLELGRYGKAMSLYKMVLEDNPQLEVELAFRMLRIHQERGDHDELRRLYRRILELTEHTEERFFCRWKLLTQHYVRSLEAIRDAIVSLEEMLGDQIPEQIPEKRLRQRLDEMKKLEKKLVSDCEGGILLVRKTGDLQIELD